jgi:succinyl-diaminopimelate desuccinylase
MERRFGMDEVKERVLKRIDTMREEAIELLADLVKADSVNPPGDTRKIMDVIVQKTQTFTQNYDTVAKEEVAPNIMITINPGARPQLLYNGHLDTVPLGEEDAWDLEPFGAVIKDNAMYGRGVADMKGGVGAMLMAAKVLQRENIPLKGSLVVNFVCDEETGGARGARHLMEQGLYSPDMVVVGEITNGNSIAIGEKGVAVYSLSTKGRTAHASTPWVGINAINKMVKVLFKMESRLGEIFKNRPSGYLPPATMNVGAIQGGISYNVVADTCSVLIDRRTLPGETVDSVTAEMQEIIDEVKSEDPEVNATLRLVGSGEPFETSPDESICQIARKTLEELNLNSDFVGYEQVSDGRFFAEKGIPTILIGPGIAQRAHTPNEHLELDQYIEAIKIYSLLAMNALGLLI